MDVHVVPSSFSDNFMYLVADKQTKEAFCVDPWDFERILSTESQLGVKLTHIFTTHHHHDHSGGNEKLLEARPLLRSIGSAYETTPGSNVQLKDQEELQIASMKVKALHVPCHTKGHLLFYVTTEAAPEEAPLLFTGDTLFVAGAGRFFEGSAEQMVKNFEKIRDLPQNTRIYCGHEYTVSNLHFALHAEPDNVAMKQWLCKALEDVKKHKPTVPSTVADELQINPFMRALNEADPVKAMTEARENKNGFSATCKPEAHL